MTHPEASGPFCQLGHRCPKCGPQMFATAPPESDPRLDDIAAALHSIIDQGKTLIALTRLYITVVTGIEFDRDGIATLHVDPVACGCCGDTGRIWHDNGHDAELAPTTCPHHNGDPAARCPDGCSQPDPDPIVSPQHGRFPHPDEPAGADLIWSNQDQGYDLVDTGEDDA